MTKEELVKKKARYEKYLASSFEDSWQYDYYTVQLKIIDAQIIILSNICQN